MAARPSAAALRIVHVSPFYWPSVGGAEGQLRAISERLAARRHRVTVITQKASGSTKAPDSSLPTREMLNGVAVHRLPVRAWPEALLRRFSRIPGGWRLCERLFGDPQLRGLLDGPLVPQLRWHAQRARPDVIVYSNYYFAGMAYGLFGPGRGRRRAHAGIPLLHLDEAWSRSPTTLDLLHRSSALFVNSAHEARFIESTGVPAARVHFLGGGVDEALFRSPRGAAIRAAIKVDRDPLVGYIGRLAGAKGTVVLIEAMRRVWKFAPRAHLLVAGHRYPRGSTSDRRIAEALAALSPDESRRLHCIEDFAEADKPALYDALDVFAMPSTSESFGIAFLEAWMCGKPVVGARIGAVECLIDHDTDGLLAPPGDVLGTADAILALVADPDRRRRLGAAGRAKTLARFTWDRVADVAEGVYETLAGRRAA